MKIVSHACIASAAIHTVYIAVMAAGGYAKTILYQPNVIRARENAEILGKEMIFSETLSPFFFGGTFLSSALIYAFLLMAYKKLTSGRNRQEIG